MCSGATKSLQMPFNLPAIALRCVMELQSLCNRYTIVLRSLSNRLYMCICYVRSIIVFDRDLVPLEVSARGVSICYSDQKMIMHNLDIAVVICVFAM
jgi:hypothetical protein